MSTDKAKISRRTVKGKPARSSKQQSILTPADLVISRFDGVRPLARKLNKLYKEIGYPIMGHASVSYWRSRYGGRIPSERIPHLQELARREKVKLTSDEILNGGVA